MKREEEILQHIEFVKKFVPINIVTVPDISYENGYIDALKWVIYGYDDE